MNTIALITVSRDYKVILVTKSTTRSTRGIYVNNADSASTVEPVVEPEVESDVKPQFQSKVESQIESGVEVEVKSEVVPEVKP